VDSFSCYVLPLLGRADAYDMISLLHVMLHAGRIRLFATHVQPSTGLFWGGLVHGRTYVSSVEHTNVSNGCFYVRDKLVHV